MFILPCYELLFKDFSSLASSFYRNDEAAPNSHFEHY